MPAIEAWYLAGTDPHAIEAALIKRKDAGTTRLKNELKRKIYGSDRASLPVKTEIGIACARRLAGDLENLERLFPNGFGPLARDVRSWIVDVQQTHDPK